MPHPRSNQSSPALRLLTHFLYCLDSRSPAVMGTGDSFLRFDPISNPTASLSLLYNEDNLEENQGNYSFLFFIFSGTNTLSGRRDQWDEPHNRPSRRERSFIAGRGLFSVVP